MPKVGGRSYPYSDVGIKKAKKAARKSGKKLVMKKVKSNASN